MNVLVVTLKFRGKTTMFSPTLTDHCKVKAPPFVRGALCYWIKNQAFLLARLSREKAPAP